MKWFWRQIPLCELDHGIFDENLDPIFNARIHLVGQIYKLSWKKVGPFFVKKLISDFDLTFFWQKLDQIFFFKVNRFWTNQMISSIKIGSKFLSKKRWSNFQKPKNHTYECRFSIFSILSCSSYPTLQHGYNHFAWRQS